MVVAVAQARFMRTGNHPAGQHVPQFHLLDQAPLDGVAGHDATQNGRRLGQPLPVFLSKPVDIFQEHRALGQQLGAHHGGVVLGPFQAGVAHIKR